MPTHGSVQLDGKRKMHNEPQEVRTTDELPAEATLRSGRVHLHAHTQSWGYLKALAFKPYAYITGPRRILSDEDILLYWARQKTTVDHDKTQDGDVPGQGVAAAEAPASSNDIHPSPDEFQTSKCESTSAGTSSSHTPENTCVICLSTEVNALIRPCGHTATCMRCAEGMWNDKPARCPICRMPIDSVYCTPHRTPSRAPRLQQH